MLDLRRLGPYLTKEWRCELTFPRQMSDVVANVHVDSDWAGDLLGRTRREWLTDEANTC